MKFACVLTVLSAGTAALASAIEKRDLNTLLNDIAQIKSQAAQVYQDIQNYNGTTNSALVIYNDSNKLSDLIKNSTQDAINTSPLSLQDSVTLANSVVTLQPQIFQTLQALVDKYNGFTAATLGFDATGLVYNSLVTQQQSAGYFGGNVTAKLYSVLQRSSPLITSNIDYHFVRAEEAYAPQS